MSIRILPARPQKRLLKKLFAAISSVFLRISPMTRLESLEIFVRNKPFFVKQIMTKNFNFFQKNKRMIFYRFSKNVFQTKNQTPFTRSCPVLFAKFNFSLKVSLVSLNSSFNILKWGLFAVCTLFLSRRFFGSLFGRQDIFIGQSVVFDSERGFVF